MITYLTPLKIFKLTCPTVNITGYFHATNEIKAKQQFITHYSLEWGTSLEWSDLMKSIICEEILVTKDGYIDFD